jgi:hypothetical protein
VSASNCSSGSIKHTAVVAIHHLPCLHKDSRRLATNQYEISGLTRIFHTNHLRRPVSQMDAALDSYFDLDSRDTYSPASKCSSALPHQPSRSPRHDQYEISGLKPGQSPDRRWCLHQDLRYLMTFHYEICG